MSNIRRFNKPKSLEMFMMQVAVKGKSFYTGMQASHITSIARRCDRKVKTSQMLGWKRMMMDKELPKFYKILKVTFLNKPRKTQK